MSTYDAYLADFTSDPRMAALVESGAIEPLTEAEWEAGEAQQATTLDPLPWLVEADAAGHLTHERVPVTNWFANDDTAVFNPRPAFSQNRQDYYKN